MFERDRLGRDTRLGRVIKAGRAMSSARGEQPLSGLHTGTHGRGDFRHRGTLSRCRAACDSRRPDYSPKYFFSPLFVVFR